MSELKYMFGRSLDLMPPDEPENKFEVATIVDESDTEVCLVDENYFDAQVVLDALNTRPNDAKWISVEDELPKKDGMYLLSAKDEVGDEITIVECWVENGWYDNNFYNIEGVTHWMPLPTPPKQSSEGEEG